MPTTVLSALVKNKVYRDIFFADNVKSVPEEAFKASGRFRTESDIPSGGPAAVGRPDQRSLKSCQRYGQRLAGLIKKLFPDPGD